MYILDIGHSIVESLRTFLFSIFEALLNAIITIYDLFMKVAEQRLFDTETIQSLYGRIGLILGLFMIFRLTFSAIEYLIDPDTMLDKQKGMGNIVKKVVIVVVLLGSIHFIFNKAYQLQTILLSGENNLIAKIFFNKSGDEAAEDNESLGPQLSWTIFSSFFTINEEACNKSDECEGIRILIDPDDPNDEAEIYNDLKVGLGFGHAYKYINEDLNEDYNWTINFEWFFGIITAALILWTLLIYLIQIGIRCIQLAYLEIIAPIPIMMYLTPKGDEKLKKWGSQCLTTYLDVFIRIAILYFILLAVTEIAKIELGSASDNGLSIKIVLIIALFMFAKKVPDLIKEIFPSMGGKASLDLGIKSPKQAWNDMKSIPILGLGASAIGYGVNKGYKAYKAKHDEVKNARRQARQDLKDYNRLEKLGAKLHADYGDNLPSSVFSSNEYRKSYENVANAKEEAKKTERALENAQADFTAAYNSTGPDREARIARARENYDNAKRENKAAQTRLDIAKQHHEHMKKIHYKDAKIEDAYNHYRDLHPSGSTSQQTSQQNSQPTRATRQYEEPIGPLTVEQAVDILNNPNSSESELEMADSMMDSIRNDRLQRENDLNWAAQTVNDPNASEADIDRALNILDNYKK